MARTNNALVTYTDLTQMNIISKVGTVPPSGNKCATKNFIDTYYNVNTAASPYSGYAASRLPRYQDIQPDPNSFLLCYNLTINSYGGSGCIGTNQYQIWLFTLTDQYGNAFYATSPVTFTITYSYTRYTDLDPPEYGTLTTTATVNTGQYQGQQTIFTYTVESCPYSGMCDGTCWVDAYDIYVSDVSPSMNGGCAFPAGTCNYTQTLFPGNFVSDPGSSTGYSWFWRAKNIGGTWENMTYSCFSNASWNIFDAAGTSVYSGYNTTYSPWNGRVGNSGAQVAAGTYFCNVDLGDGSGVKFVKVIKGF